MRSPTGLGLCFRLLVVWLFCADLSSGPAVAQTVPQSETDRQIARGLNMVVRVHTNDPWHGGGIIVGASPESIYIITARHVLNEGSPDSVRVWFHFNQTNAVTARILSDSSKEKSLTDVALISVPRRSAIGFETAGLEFDRMGVPDRLHTGDRVISVGCPADICWEVEPDEHVLGVGTEIVIYSQFVRTGKSGGALLNEWGEVTGMILLEEGVLPVGRAINIEPVLNQVRVWLTQNPPQVLHRPTFPRGGYALDLGAAVLSSAHNSSGRAPSARVDLEGHLQRLLDWHLGVLRLAPNDLALTAATAGLAMPLRFGRLTAAAHLDAGMGRTEARHDVGGYSTTTSGITTYVPNWATAQGFGFGGGFGVSMKLLVAPRMFIEIMAARWTFQTPVDSPPIPDVFYGAGLRWAIQ
jgi:hypothetical protein